MHAVTDGFVWWLNDSPEDDSIVARKQIGQQLAIVRAMPNPLNTRAPKPKRLCHETIHPPDPHLAQLPGRQLPLHNCRGRLKPSAPDLALGRGAGCWLGWRGGQR
ncbi:hypothetical protein BDK51DRAFT_47939 [Blyttiomyces helicus]|uniref:Uncharacterized protein n=1 Tax=Blyttiomyces helicus TaxID=388810 RepID=A0A4P9W5Z9_9FUNG|nr:hypothetical protein BDK51DRAFT_47939 [Blyttiomyces helicus]|eukprot:RKO86765.1 hypothetical protein BDK51DRAFT_47939 [Blyttiomyces helicus]